MHDLVKKTSLHNAYFLSLHNKNKNVMERKSYYKLPFYSFKNSYKPLWIWYFNQQVTLVGIVTFIFVFKIVLALIFSICLLSLHKRNNCRYGETVFVIITLHTDNNRNGEKFLFHYLRVIVIKWFFLN